jgi:hypothetical protein
LEADADADEDLADDESIHILCKSADDAANECKTAADNEEPCRKLSA